jgi:hypothetical protein
MENNKENSAIETILAIPRNRNLYSYRINNGTTHILKKEEMVPYLKQFIKKEDIKVILDYLDRFRPFLIIVKKQKIVELVKSLDTNDYYSDQIKQEIFNLNLTKTFRTPKKEFASNEEKLQKKIGKFLNYKV